MAARKPGRSTGLKRTIQGQDVVNSMRSGDVSPVTRTALIGITKRC
jgi:hypothetical protein